MVTSQLVSDKNGGTQVFKFGNMPSYYLIEDAPQKLLNYCKTNKRKKHLRQQVRNLKDSAPSRTMLFIPICHHRGKRWFS